MSIRPVRIIFIGVLALAATVAGAAQDIPIRNWGAPASSQIATMGDISFPATFVAVSPCRVVDTRVGQGFSGAYGPPALAQGSPRTFNIPASPQCTGIPAGAAAFSLNFTVTNTAGPGFILVYPAGGTAPTVSTLNYVAGQTVANAAVVPSGTGGNQGSITVIAGVSNTDLIIDINGYYINNSGGGSMNSNEYVGIVGNTDPTYIGLLYVKNNATSAGRAGIRGTISNTGAGSYGTSGENSGASGANWGVYGVNASSGDGAAGVFGVAGSATAVSTFWPTGVRGESTTGNGILGFDVAAGSFAVGGWRVDGSGALLRGGRIGGDTSGVEFVNGLSGTGTKSFVEPHPSDAGRMIKYVALEGPEAGTYFRGRGRIVGGTAVIDVPENFRMVTDPEGITVQVTPIGRATAYVVRIGLDSIEVEASRDVEFSYLVQGVRKAYRDVQPIVENTFFRPSGPDDRMPPLSDDEKQRLIDNGTYNADGTVNMATAERLGWAKQWREAEAARRASALSAAREIEERNQDNGGLRLLP